MASSLVKKLKQSKSLQSFIHNLSKAFHLLQWTPEMNPEDYR